MRKFDVVINLEHLRESRKKWGAARTEFFAGYDVVLRRLLHEGVNNFMSASDMAAVLGVSTKTVRAKMRSIGLDPRLGKRALSDQAAKALVGNAELLGIEPHQMDLMSPLAYLPMGDQMKRDLENRSMAPATELEEPDYEVLGRMLHRALQVKEDMYADFRGDYLILDGTIEGLTEAETTALQTATMA